MDLLPLKPASTYRPFWNNVAIKMKERYGENASIVIFEDYRCVSCGKEAFIDYTGRNGLRGLLLQNIIPFTTHNVVLVSLVHAKCQEKHEEWIRSLLDLKSEQIKEIKDEKELRAYLKELIKRQRQGEAANSEG